jgi:hypothetical protein
MSSQDNGLQFLNLIVDKKKKDKFLSLLSEYGAHSLEVVYAHGSVSKSALAQAFGFEVSEHKVLITCLMKNDKARELLNVLYHEYDFKKPNTGIAFGIPVEGLAF